MAKLIDGVIYQKHDNYAVCHVRHLSEQLKDLIRSNLATICHGSRVQDYGTTSLYSYIATLRSFLDRYNEKSQKTKIGMIGEFLSHILITKIFSQFDVASAFFNLEEKSIKKGFDIILFNLEDQSAWITEVKSGNLHAGKNYDQTAKELLNTAKIDLIKRLNESQTMYWHNAVNSVRCALSDNKDYKRTLVDILISEGELAEQRQSKCNDNCVVLIASLFELFTNAISDAPAKDTIEALEKKRTFKRVIAFCIQKKTYAKVVEFLNSEINES